MNELPHGEQNVEGALPNASSKKPDGLKRAADTIAINRRGLVWAAAGIALGATGGVMASGSVATNKTGAHAVKNSSTPATTFPPTQGNTFQLTPEEVRTLRIVPAGKRDFKAELVAEGRISYNEDHSTPVFSPYAGRVVKTIARVGITVRAGDPLFEMETADLAGAANDFLSALDNLRKSQETYDQAMREESRQVKLLAGQASSTRDLEQARTAARNASADHRSAMAAVDAAKDKLRVLGRSPEEIRALEVNRRINAIVPVLAPISGTVTQRKIGAGQWITSGSSEPTFTISDLSSMWLVASVREIDAPFVRVGQNLKVTLTALPGRIFDATISTVGSSLDTSTRRLSVWAEVEDPDRLLKPEMFATFRVEIGEPQTSVSIPLRAIIFRGNEATAWVALSNNIFELRRLTLGLRTGNRFQVISGITEGEGIVDGGALFIDRASRID
jgi:cobalt-zinc-cadmium efflux system membrane fusion protein